MKLKETLGLRISHLKVLRWERGLDLYIYISCINPKAVKWKRHLVKGVGVAALACEKEKIQKYADKIDDRTGLFLPFIVEVQGGVGKAAADFMLEIQKRKREKSCELGQAPTSTANVDLMTTLSIELQRLNSEMILQRQPTNKALEVQDIEKMETAVQSAIYASKRAIQTREALMMSAPTKPSPQSLLSASNPGTEGDDRQHCNNMQFDRNPHLQQMQRTPKFPGYKNDLKKQWNDVESLEDIDFSASGEY